MKHHLSFVVVLAFVGCGDDRESAPNTGVESEAASKPSAAQSGTKLELASGVVQGLADSETRSFIGIPYAAPPIGERRWKPPAAVEPWDGVLDATGPGVQCMQAEPWDGPELSEDCLQLNVYAPAHVSKKPVPVMVWLYGGSNFNGSANQQVGADQPRAYDGARLATAARDVVVVVPNYRLDTLGFLAHPALTEEQGTSGNYGLKDQQAALRWVQQNISAFGGDPGNVTLFGESAGAFDVCYQQVATGREGLFHRAILESGACVAKVRTLREAETAGRKVAAAVGCDGDDARALECLRALPAEEVLEPLPKDAQDVAIGGGLFVNPNADARWVWSGDDPGLLAVIDDDFLLEQPVRSFASGRFAHMPTIIGTNAREGTWFLSGESVFVDEAQYSATLEATFGALGPKVREQYPIEDYASVNDAAIEVAGDFAFVCPAWSYASLASRYADVYVYDWKRAAEKFEPFAELGPAHAVELTWVWNWWQTMDAPSAEELGLAQQVAEYWTTLAATGDPNGRGLPKWPRYESAKDPELALDLQPKVEEGRRSARCKFWSDVAAANWGDDWAAAY